MAIRLKRDGQQWLYNRMIQDTGKTLHFQGPNRGSLPRSISQHDMVSKHVARGAFRLRRLAQEEEVAGHPQTALELYFAAVTTFAAAQHTILETNEEKRFLHALLIECYDRVRLLAPYPIDRIEIPWGDGRVFGNLHLLSDRRRAPCVIFIPGCDMVKEHYPYPFANHAHQRGMHIIAMDGPGQGECNIDGTRLTAENYETAISAVIDYLLTREEVDPDAILLFGHSFGSFWSFRAAAHDDRFRAAAHTWASIADKRHITDVEAPRWKQLFAYVTQAETERELDEILDAMTTRDVAADIRCPSLVSIGEYDPRSPLHEIQEIYDLMTCERQLWVYEDQHHNNSVMGNFVMNELAIWNHDNYWWVLDWLHDRLVDRPMRHSGEVLFLRAGGVGPDAPDVDVARSWIELVAPGDRPTAGQRPDDGCTDNGKFP